MLFYELSLHLLNHPKPLEDEKLRLLAPHDLSRLAIGTGRLYRAHIANARFLVNPRGHPDCQAALSSYWARVVEPILYAGERMLDGWIRLRDKVEMHGIQVGFVPVVEHDEAGVMYTQRTGFQPCDSCKEQLKEHIVWTADMLIEQLVSSFMLD